MTKQKEIDKIRKQLENLKSSPLYEYRVKNNYKPVIGEGSLNAKIMFIGEAPGKTEAETGQPFCGAAGKVLDDLLEFIELKRKDVYITNLVNDRPPGNRDPNQEEIKQYSPFLIEQIKIIRPKILATLGRIPMYFIMKTCNLDSEVKSISKIHGKTFTTKTSYGNINIIPLYHPAAALYNPHLQPVLKQDIKNIVNMLA
jgi:DNA polymerase